MNEDFNKKVKAHNKRMRQEIKLMQGGITAGKSKTAYIKKIVDKLNNTPY